MNDQTTDNKNVELALEKFKKNKRQFGAQWADAYTTALDEILGDIFPLLYRPVSENHVMPYSAHHVRKSMQQFLNEKNKLIKLLREDRSAISEQASPEP